MALVCGFSRQADPVTCEIVEEMLQDKLEHGVFGLGGAGATGPEPVEARPGPMKATPGRPTSALAGRKALAQLPEAGSEHAFDPETLRKLLAVTAKKG